MRRSIFVALAGLSAPAIIFACEGGDTASVGLAMSAPQGLLDDASAVTLHVFPAGQKVCAEDGSAEVPGDAKKFPLKKSGCEGGATWCGDLTLERDESNQMFYVEVTGGGSLLAQGCATAKIDQDPVDVDIKIVRFVTPSCCGDGVLQAGETCDTGPEGGECSEITADAVCESDCTTKDIPIDFIGASGGAVGQTQLALTFGAGSGQLDGALRAVWQTNSTMTADVGVRYLRGDLTPLTDPPPYAQTHKLLLDCDGSDSPMARGQTMPAIAPIGNGVLVAFISNFRDPLHREVQAVELPAAGCNTAAAANVSPPAMQDVVAVDVAQSTVGVALIVWEINGQILGATYTSQDPSAGLISAPVTIAAGRTPRVGGFAGGWVVTYQGAEAGDDDGVFVRRISGQLAVGAAETVNTNTAGTQNQPDVGVLADGRYTVAWVSAGDVFFQRFSASGAPVEGDQELPIHVATDGEQLAPAVTGASGFFAVAWESGSEIRARLVGPDGGFLFNPISGQNDDFPVTQASAAPKKPTMAVGDYLVFGWEDLSAAQPGMYVRRFPLPG
jgi:hypothetical protein